MAVKHSSEMDELPEFLYHGTDCKNIDSICEKGIMPGSYDTCNPYTKADGLGKSHVEDCIGTVSLAVDMKDAIFFIVANRRTKEEFDQPQCILKIKTNKLDTNKLFFRNLFHEDLGEAKLLWDVPPEAIEGYLVRTFDWKVKGDDKVKEEWKRCPLKKEG